jgi:transposase
MLFKRLITIVVKLQLVNAGINCPNCSEYISQVHQTRSVLVRDLSIFGQVVYLKVPRRQFYCSTCKKSPTEPLLWVNKKQRQTNRYQEYIYERVKELTVKLFISLVLKLLVLRLSPRVLIACLNSCSTCSYKLG